MSHENNDTKAEDTAGSAAPDAAQKWNYEAETLCIEMEQLFRRAFGEVPRATDLGDLRALQSMLKNLVRKAASEGTGAEQSEQLAALTAERDKHKDNALRAKADFLNYQSRAGKDLDRAEEQALRKYVTELLPILDNLDLANADAQTANDPQRVKEALDMTSQSLKQAMAVRGLERIAALGKTYDPNQHEAVFKRPADAAKGEKPNTCVEDLRAGYLWKGLVLRPVQVVVTDAGK